MESDNKNNLNKKSQLVQVLNDLKQRGAFPGVLLAYKDGGLIHSIINEDIKPLEVHELSSMCASVLESANNISAVIGEEKPKKIVAELRSYILIIVPCHKDVFLTFIIDENSHVFKILDSIEEHKKKILFLYQSQ